MNLYARSLFFEFAGTDQLFPPDPIDSVDPGKRNEPHWNFAVLSMVPYHQLPDAMMGLVPAMKESSMSCALRDTSSLLKYPLSAQSLMVFAA